MQNALIWVRSQQVNAQMSVSERIREAAAMKSLNIKDFAEAIGVSYRTVQNYIGEDRTVGADFLTACSTRLGVSATWLLTGIGEPLLPEKHPIGDSRDSASDPQNPPQDFVPVPRFAVEAAAGAGALPDGEETTGFYAFNKKWLARRGLASANLAVISVRGDSMEPRLSSGDLILIDRAQRQIVDGLAFVVRLGTDLVVKHVQRISPDAISLISANRMYPPREVALSDLDSDSHQTEIIGRVVASMHEW